MALVLIVEDNISTLKFLSNYVKKMGHIPIKCQDGQMAWTFLQDNHEIVDVLVTDLKMPNMDGRELINHMQNDDKIKRIPIIVQSDYLGVHNTIKLMEDGASFVFPKPLEYKVLEDHINKVL